MRISDWSSDVCSSDLVSHHIGDRVVLNEQSTLTVKADPVMVRMLLRNLVQNAAQHTNNDIQVTITETAIEIEDRGMGLSADQQAILRGERKIASDGSTISGLGLYIVTLMAERLSRSEEHTSELQSLMRISNAVF